ncbi:hypothetical protein HORM4_510023 [Vibrio harveyi]|nr:hypothetical protein HORM4_510023 [Vibrio harveyi]
MVFLLLYGHILRKNKRREQFQSDCITSYNDFVPVLGKSLVVANSKACCLVRFYLNSRRIDPKMTCDFAYCMNRCLNCIQKRLYWDEELHDFVLYGIGYWELKVEKVESEDAPKIDVKEVIEQRRLSKIKMANKRLKQAFKQSSMTYSKVTIRKMKFPRIL